MRRCGRGRNECVVLVVEHASSGDIDLVHPKHSSGPGGYEVDADWLGRFAAHQTDQKIVVRAQLHTHPAVAFHSATDDAWPMIGTPGFISVVVPRLGKEPLAIDQLYSCQLSNEG